MALNLNNLYSIWTSTAINSLLEILREQHIRSIRISLFRNLWCCFYSLHAGKCIIPEVNVHGLSYQFLLPSNEFLNRNQDYKVEIDVISIWLLLPAGHNAGQSSCISVTWLAYHICIHCFLCCKTWYNWLLHELSSDCRILYCTTCT